MRGFPIRRSSDHGSFANSPRHIAGYHVLLRLLVPRHPPCALINFNHRKQRCSRPLCSSQTTTRPTTSPRHPTTHQGELVVSDQWPPTIPHTTAHEEAARCRLDPKKPHAPARLFPQDPTVCLAPAASRPARFLPHTKVRGVLGACRQQAGCSRRSTLSTTPHTFGVGVDPGPPVKPAGRCSLERR